MGTVNAALALGTSTLIAKVVPMSDAETQDALDALYVALASGMSPTSALAAAQSSKLEIPGFVCFGAGSAVTTSK